MGGIPVEHRGHRWMVVLWQEAPETVQIIPLEHQKHTPGGGDHRHPHRNNPLCHLRYRALYTTEHLRLTRLPHDESGVLGAAPIRCTLSCSCTRPAAAVHAATGRVPHCTALSPHRLRPARPQWLAFAGSLFLVALIARELGAERKAVRFALVFAATLPIGILQSTNATATHTVTFWLLMLAYLILRDRCSQSPANALRIGIVLGLSLLTKSNAYFFAPVLILWYAISLRKRPTRLLRHTLIVGSIALSLNAAHYLRNIESFGHFLAPERDRAININTEFSPAFVASNILKNASLETGLLMVGNPFAERTVQNIHAMMHVELDHTNAASRGFNIPITQTHEVSAGNPFHSLLILLSVMSVPLLSLPKKKQHYWYLGAILGCLVITWSFLRWSPYGTRLHMPFLMLAAPSVGIAFATAIPGKWLRFIAAFLYVTAIPALLFSDLNPIVPNTLLMGKGAPSTLTTDRWLQYFYDIGPKKQAAYEHAIDELMRMECHKVGVLSHYQYPLFVRAKQMGADIRFVSMTEKPLPFAQQEHLCALLFIDEGKKYLPAGQGDANGEIVLLPVQESPSGGGDAPGTVL